MRQSLVPSSGRLPALLAALVSLATATAFAPPRTIITLNSVGLNNVTVTRDGIVGRILVYANGRAFVGTGTQPLRVLTDTLTLRSLTAITADVTDADVHIELVGESLPGFGSITVGGSVTRGTTTKVSATGRHLLLLKGGEGIRVVPAR